MPEEKFLPRLQLAECRVYAYELPLIRPMTMMGRRATTRQGYLLELLDQHGHRGWGEVAPFPGLHPESLQQAQAELLALASGQRHLELDPTEILAGPSLLSGSASVRFGLAMARLGLLAASAEQTPAQLLLPQARPARLGINALLSDSPEQILAEARQLAKQGFTVFKLKVGRSDPEADVALVRQLRQTLNPAIRLRLDANRAWTADQALVFGQGVAGLKLDYIEEPLVKQGSLPAQLAALRAFHADTGLAYALDESWVEAAGSTEFFGGAMPEIPTGLRALIWRPNVLGDWRQPLVSPALRLILANAFESGLSLATFAALACGLKADAMGLDTYRWLARDVLAERIPIRGGLDPTEAWRLAKHIDYQRLTRLM